MSGEKPITDPLLIDLPERIATARLVLRPPRPGDGAVVNPAVSESIEDLRPWMPWATPAPTVEQTELWCRKAHAEFAARKQLPLLAFLRDAPSTFVGSTGLHRIVWDVPSFEIGYWVRRRFVRQGYVSEAVEAITSFAFEVLGAERVEIRMDDRNERSWRVAERLGFPLEGVLRRESRAPDGTGRDTRVYAKTRPTAG